MLTNLPGYVISETNEKIRAAIKFSLIKQAHDWMGICEQLRFIYDTVHLLPDGEIKDDLTEKLIDALIMGKKMNSRLVKYKKKYNDTTGHAGKNIKKIPHTKTRAKIRFARTI